MRIWSFVRVYNCRRTVKNSSNPVHVIEAAQNEPFYIQLSGCADIFDASDGYGQPSKKGYDDVEDIREISSFHGETHLHAPTNRCVVREGKKSKVRTVILLPPLVYGLGNGPIKSTSMQLPWYISATQDRGKAFMIGQGMNRYSMIHVKDLANAVEHLVRRMSQS
jgi:nucleoside-diphosphate-sugar epimerase